MISITTYRTCILRIISIPTSMRVRLILTRSKVRAYLRVHAFTLILQNFNVSKVISNGSGPILFNNDRCKVCPKGLLLMVLLTNVKVNLTFITMFIGRQNNICPGSTSNDTIILRHLNVVANKRNPTTTSVAMIRRDLHVTTMFIITRRKRPICRRLQITMGGFMINRPGQIIRTACTFGIICVTNNGGRFKTCFFYRLSRRFNSKLLIMMTIATRIINCMRIRLLIRSKMVNSLNGNYITR